MEGQRIKLVTILILTVVAVSCMTTLAICAEEKKEELPKQLTEEPAKPEKKKKRMTLLEFVEGEIPNISNVSLSTEHPLKDRKHSIKVTVREDGNASFTLISKGSDLLKGKKGNWKDYATLNIKYLSKFKTPIKYAFLLGDEKTAAKFSGNYYDKSEKFLPGEHTLSVDITALETWRDKRALDLEKMRIIMFYSKHYKVDKKGVIYIQDVYVEEK